MKKDSFLQMKLISNEDGCIGGGYDLFNAQKTEIEMHQHFV
jgi:hypothetical protein